MGAGPGRAYLRIGVELLYNLPGPRLYLSGFRVEALIEVHAAEIILRCKHEPYPPVALFLTGSHSFLVSGPGLRDRTISPLACGGRVRNFCRLTVAFLGTPAKPLSKVSYVQSVCYHVDESSRFGEDTKPSPLPTSLKTASPRTCRLHRRRYPA